MAQILDNVCKLFLMGNNSAQKQNNLARQNWSRVVRYTIILLKFGFLGVTEKYLKSKIFRGFQIPSIGEEFSIRIIYLFYFQRLK